MYTEKSRETLLAPVLKNYRLCTLTDGRTRFPTLQNIFFSQDICGGLLPYFIRVEAVQSFEGLLVTYRRPVYPLLVLLLFCGATQQNSESDVEMNIDFAFKGQIK